MEDAKKMEEEDKARALRRGIVKNAAMESVEARASGRTAMQDIDDL
jgi:hypothetical protein